MYLIAGGAVIHARANRITAPLSALRGAEGALFNAVGGPGTSVSSGKLFGSLASLPLFVMTFDRFQHLDRRKVVGQNLCFARDRDILARLDELAQVVLRLESLLCCSRPPSEILWRQTRTAVADQDDVSARFDRIDLIEDALHRRIRAVEEHRRRLDVLRDDAAFIQARLHEPVELL